MLIKSLKSLMTIILGWITKVIAHLIQVKLIEAYLMKIRKSLTRNLKMAGIKRNKQLHLNNNHNSHEALTLTCININDAISILII